jgi:hypothetical protein
MMFAPIFVEHTEKDKEYTTNGEKFSSNDAR